MAFSGHFTLHDLHGRQPNSLVYHAHQLNLLGNNRFALFDNGRMNTFSSTVVIKVDEEEQQAYLEFRSVLNQAHSTQEHDA